MSEIEDVLAMEAQGWRDRLRAEIKRKGLSLRAVSLAINHGPGYVFSILKEGKEPSVESLVAICAVLDIPLYRIIYGDDPNGWAEEIVDLWKDAPPSTRQAILALLRDRKAS